MDSIKQIFLKNISKISLFFIASILLISTTYFEIKVQERPKLAVIDTDVILAKYAGIQEARSIYQEKIDRWKATLDTLRLSLEDRIAEYESSQIQLSESHRLHQEETLQIIQADYEKQVHLLNTQAKEEEAALLQGALSQINEYIKNYAKEHGYDIVLGNSTTTANVLFSTETFDITNAILTSMNETYYNGSQ